MLYLKLVPMHVMFMIAVLARTITADGSSPPPVPVRLFFIHHSVGDNWLDSAVGGLGNALKDNNYFVATSNYGWGPNSIGDRTDVPNWPDWFTGPNSSTIMAAAYAESSAANSSCSQLSPIPAGENEIVMFKSSFTNSNVDGNPPDPPLLHPNSYDYTVSNFKAMYQNILQYFANRKDKLFIVVTAPPLIMGETSDSYAANARAINNWLVNDWLQAYPYSNVCVFDLFNVLTSNGGNANTNDLGASTGNHHRIRNGTVEHIVSGTNNTLNYPTGDSHPSKAGLQKATGELVPLLNWYYNRWKGETSAFKRSHISMNPVCVSVQPNPATREVNITWQGVHPVRPQVRICDAMGKTVYNFPAFAQPAKNGDLHWSGCNQRLRTVAPGIYFCCVEIERQLWVGRILTVR